jgi:hypothetical protein
MALSDILWNPKVHYRALKILTSSLLGPNIFVSTFVLKYFVYVSPLILETKFNRTIDKINCFIYYVCTFVISHNKHKNYIAQF